MNHNEPVTTSFDFSMLESPGRKREVGGGGGRGEVVQNK